MLLILAGCLFSPDVYERRLAELTDHDGDGFKQEDDCDDRAADVHPGAPELCNGVDDDCDSAVDEDAADAPVWFVDADGDEHGVAAGTVTGCTAPSGFAAAPDDCDDTVAAVHPGADDPWYDGVDSNCDGADDYDADTDGDPTPAGGGTDCDDTDAAVSGATPEGWSDGGVDNNCDGSVDDPARVAVGTLGARIDGSVAGGAFGVTVVTLPAGWVDDEPVLLAAAPFTEAGDVYGWRASELAASPNLSSAPWHVQGAEASAYLGYGMGWAGNAEQPLTVLGSEGAAGTRGTVSVWAGARLSSEPDLTIEGDSVGGFLGGQVVSGYDHDGDGLADVLVGAQGDSRIAANAGVVFLFLAGDTLTGAVPTTAADLTFTNPYGGALMTAANLGDTDDDGLEDLGFGLIVAYDEGPGGLVVPGGLHAGTHDVVLDSTAQLYAAGNAFSRVADWDGDGVREILVASGGLERYELPLRGAVTPWDNAAAHLAFTDPADTVTALDTAIPGYGGHNTFLCASATYSGGTGGIFVQSAYWPDETTVDEARFSTHGDAAGDRLGASFAGVNPDDDPVVDLALGAPGADNGGVDAGAVYVVPGPR